jgi:hypothetical protein
MKHLGKARAFVAVATALAMVFATVLPAFAGRWG